MHALLIAMALALASAAQDGRPASPSTAPPAQPVAPAAPAAPPAAADLPPVEAPPKLPATKVEELDLAIKNLRVTKVEARAKNEAVVEAFGRAAIPALIGAASTTHPGQMDGIDNCLVALADLRDRDLVERSLTDKLPVVRRFAARKAGEYRLPALIDKLPELLHDKDDVTRNEAALALVANGREEGLDVLVLIFKSDWRDRVLAALPGVAGQGDHAPVASRLKIDPQREKEEPEAAAMERLAAVELLHAVGDHAAQVLLVRALDDKHNVVQREAINALRDLLEHKGPLDKSSIFQQINEVKRLKDVWAAASG